MRLDLLFINVRLSQHGAQSSIFNTQLVHERTALFPSPVGLIRRSKRSVKKLRTRFERFDMSVIVIIIKCPSQQSISR
jgi:hypothetical protein